MSTTPLSSSSHSKAFSSSVALPSNVILRSNLEVGHAFPNKGSNGLQKCRIRRFSLSTDLGSPGLEMSPISAYEEALDAMSTLITDRGRVTPTSSKFYQLFQYVKMLGLEDSISQLKIIHVAGTKGKGSTCIFTESILRNCGFHTGLFLSPHLIDVRERFQLDGVDICEDKFLTYFWWCWDRLKENCDENNPMPSYFHFLALMAFKIFSAEQVDVGILEVGLGGRFDATNLVQTPIVCGITSLGFDHMEVLGYTLAEIAREKAGIFKRGIPAFTVAQPEEAMHVLEETALNLDVLLEVVPSLNASLLMGQHLALDGEHQFLNAGLAITLCYSWLERTGNIGHITHTESLPKEFIKGLTTANFQGRAEVVPDSYIRSIGRPCDLVFYLDGAHSPESMEMCGRWFCQAIRHTRDSSANLSGSLHDDATKKSSSQILLFNCLSMRDPQLLLPPLMKTCASQGIHFEKAVFVRNTSLPNKVGSHSLTPPSPDCVVDVSWQLTLQKAWENLILNEPGNSLKSDGCIDNDGEIKNEGFVNSSVFSSLPLAVKWLRDTAVRNQFVEFQVLVTGSLHLVGDVLKLVKR